MTPDIWIEHVFGMPIAAPLALLLFSVVRILSLAGFAQTFLILAFPLPFRKLRFELLPIAAVAHVRRHVLLFNGLPIYLFTTQDFQQQLWTFQVALAEQRSIKGSEYKQVLHLFDSGECHVAGHWAGAGAYLHVHDCCFQRLPLRSVCRPGKGWRRAGSLLLKGVQLASNGNNMDTMDVIYQHYIYIYLYIGVCVRGRYPRKLGIDT